MFFGLSGLPPDISEKVLKNYIELQNKAKQPEKINKKPEKKFNHDKFMEMVKKNPPRSFKDVLEYSMISSYYTK
tara:strand:+ start:1536 stop:1757 length:222 start_codon:yes stop_codon:yes gene_type:complete